MMMMMMMMLQLQQEIKEQARSLEVELSQSKQEIASLKDQLELNRLHLDQQQDYRKSYAEGLLFTCLNIRCIVL